MKKIGFAVGMLLLSTCAKAASHPVDLSKTDRGTLAGCPVLPGVDTIEIIQRDGPDFRVCTYEHRRTGRTLFEVYIGEHPNNPVGLRYGGTTRANGKDLVWFNTPTGGWGTPRIWHTYLATGSPRGTVMVVTFTTYAPDQLKTFATLVAHLQPRPPIGGD
jgi:hypothetical protein